MGEKPLVFTIGFTKTSANRFFDRLKSAGVSKVLDVRLHNTSQLSGFAKADDLAYFLKSIANIDYEHVPILAPEDEMLSEFRKGKGAWSVYSEKFLRLMASRKIEEKLLPRALDHTCLLCSESTPHHCHRKLVCDYLNEKWGNALSVTHL